MKAGEIVFVRKFNRVFQNRGFKIRGSIGVVDQDTRTSCRRKWCGYDEFGVISEPVLVVGIGPRPIEYKFAERIMLDIHRHCGNDALPVSFEYQMLGQPASFISQTILPFQANEKFVA